MATRFRFEPFQPEAERWAHYVDPLEFALEVQGYTSEYQKKVALISICSAEQYGVIASYVYPTPVSSMAVISEQSYPPAIAEDEFLNRRQGPDEPLSAYVAELRRLAAFCEFHGGHQGRIKAQLMRGAAHPEARAKLLRNPHKRSLEECIKLIQSYENGDRDMRRTRGAPGGAASPWRAVLHPT